jgi:D-lactate dehydrogenase (cytochrome)
VQVKTQLEDIQSYLIDASNMSGGFAERLVIPDNADEIADLLREANESGTPVTISGGRTGTVGGAIPFGGVLVSLERVNKIISIDRTAMTMVVEPGVLLSEIQKAADSEGVYYPPDPTEWSCQIGGNAATNASGARSFKYGATRNYIIGMTVVLADGDVVKLRRGEIRSNDDGVLAVTTTSGRRIAVKAPTYPRPAVRKNVSGYFNEQPLDAIDLFIGSEGTLGVITELELRLINKPKGFFSGVVFFNDHNDLLNFVDAAKRRSFATRADVTRTSTEIDAALIEYFDDKALGFVREKFPETPDGVAGAVYFEQETTPETEDALFEMWNDLLEHHKADLDRSWFTTTDQDREKMRAFRHALPLAANERYARYKFRKVSTDMAVPDEIFARFLKFQKEMLDASDLEYIVFGHIGDCHLHVNIFPKSDDEVTRARHIYGRFIAQAIMIGGCISAEHGTGKLKTRYLYVMMGERYLNEMTEVKRAFDPRGILGRGNVFEPTFL